VDALENARTACLEALQRQEERVRRGEPLATYTREELARRVDLDLMESITRRLERGSPATARRGCPQLLRPDGPRSHEESRSNDPERGRQPVATAGSNRADYRRIQGPMEPAESLVKA
jgi:hypothetical protein